MPPPAAALLRVIAEAEAATAGAEDLRVLSVIAAGEARLSAVSWSRYHHAAGRAGGSVQAKELSGPVPDSSVSSERIGRADSGLPVTAGAGLIEAAEGRAGLLAAHAGSITGPTVEEAG
jgi:hypothetical protein